MVLDLFDVLEIKTTFLFTGDAARNHPEVAQLCAQHCHEVGCHSLQHETEGDLLFDLPGEKMLLPQEVEPRRALNAQLVEDAIGIKLTTFRCPRLGGQQRSSMHLRHWTSQLT